MFYKKIHNFFPQKNDKNRDFEAKTLNEPQKKKFLATAML